MMPIAQVVSFAWHVYSAPTSIYLPGAPPDWREHKLVSSTGNILKMNGTYQASHLEIRELILSHYESGTENHQRILNQDTLSFASS
jgi:hypothetical protein